MSFMKTNLPAFLLAAALAGLCACRSAVNHSASAEGPSTPGVAPSSAQGCFYSFSEHVNCRGGELKIANVTRGLFTDDFSGGGGCWEGFNNLGNRLAFRFGENRGAVGLTISLKDGDDADTAFELTSKPFRVMPGSDFALHVSAMGNYDLGHGIGQDGRFFLSRVEWFNGGGNLLGAFPFAVEAGLKSPRPNVFRGKIPLNAASARIRIGADSPDFRRDSFITFTDVRFDSEDAESRLWSSGYIVSAPFPVQAPGSRISWSASVPDGAAVGLQIATAPDNGGAPAAWSSFHGPGMDESRVFLSPGQQLPEVPHDHKWMRYKLVLRSFENRSPSVGSVSIGGHTESRWIGRDLLPPAISMLSSSVSRNPVAPVSFSVKDGGTVDWRTLECRIDGQDVTAMMSRNGDRLTYTPARPFAPVERDFGDISGWSVSDIHGNLSVEMLPSQGNTVRITRDAGDADTSFLIVSPPRRVQPGAKYWVLVDMRHNLRLPSSGRGGDPPLRICWLDSGGKEAGPVATAYAGITNGWKAVGVSAVAPPGACFMEIHIGFSSPDIFDGRYFDCRNARVTGPEPPRHAPPPNFHCFQIGVSDISGNRAEEDFCLLVGASSGTAASVHADGILRVDGRPFFPVCLYGLSNGSVDGMDFSAALSEMRRAGFNSAYARVPAGGGDYRDFLDAAARLGVKALVAPGDSSRPGDSRLFLQGVAEDMGSKTIIGWCLDGGASSRLPSDSLARLSAALKGMDPTRLAVLALSPDGLDLPDAAESLRAADLLMPELYPFRKGGMPEDRCIPHAITAMRETARQRGDGARAIVPVLQAFGWKGGQERPDFRALRAMTYLCIIHGANGIAWNGFGEAGGMPADKELWKELCRLARELGSLQEVLAGQPLPMAAPKILSGPRRDALGYVSINAACRRFGGTTLLICANSSSSQVEASFHVPAADVASVRFESRSIPIRKGRFRDSFGPYEVHVYELKGLFK